MPKGLQRSLSRGPMATQNVVRRTIELKGRTVTVSATGAAIGFGSTVIDKLPEGNILVLGVVGNVGFAGSGTDDNLAAAWSGDYSLGTTPADDATLTNADVDLAASTAIGPATAEVIAPTRVAKGDFSEIFDNTDGSLELNLNLLIDAANIVDDESVEITLSGTIDLAYIVLGDD